MADLDNPYQPPASRVADEPDVVPVDGTFIEGGRRVDAGRGWEWIREGYRFFRRHAGVWVLLTVILFALVVGIQLVPLIGQLAMTLLLPVFIGGLMAGCQAIERGGEVELAHLFAGFRRNTGQLMLVGAIWVVLTLIAMLPVLLVTGIGTFLAAGSPNAGMAAVAFGAGALIGGLVTLALLVPVNMAVWFSPALVMLRDHSAPRAIGQSFRGTLKNIVPFLIFGVILFGLAIVASIPFGLGWLVLAPVVTGSVYAAYRDIYFHRG